MCQPRLLPTAPITTKAPPNPMERLQRNHRRSHKLTAARRKNLRYHPQVYNLCQQVMLHDEDARTAALPYLETYRKNLLACASNSLYRKLNDSKEATLITALVCSHRLCNVCNMMRARKLRRKWRAFLTDCDRDVPIRKAQRHFFEEGELDTGRTLLSVDTETGEVTERHEPGAFTSGADILRRFDMMHLTLTVPHSGGKWCGKEYYARELLQKFNEMRKARWWVETVFGGEYSVETTRTDNGLHIHIHALLFVDKRIRRSRNFLQVEILKRWNALTIDVASATPQTFTDAANAARLDGLRRSTAHLPVSAFQELCSGLDGRGSTLVGVKSLYFEIRPGQASQYRSAFEQGGKWYAYAGSGNINAVLKGVTECLKYHFEPCALEDEEGNLDTVMLCQMLPNIFRQRLYGKFGGFYAVKALNVVEEPLSGADLLQEAAETASVAFHPRTGAEVEPGEYAYVIADARSVTFHPTEPLQYIRDEAVKRVISPHDSGGLGMAIQALAHYGYGREKFSLRE